jgi:signal peptidase I
MDFETNDLRQKNDKNQSSVKLIAAFIWDLVKILVVALALIIPFRTFVAEPFVVSGSSMLPNFHNRDYLIIDRISYHIHSPKRGDVIVLKFPKDTSQYYIKRIIGLPGDQISCQKGKVSISREGVQQSTVLEENYLPSNVQTTNCKPLTVLGSDEFFVLGDNRIASSDSRVWGILPRNDIVGKAWLRIFPLNDSGSIKSPTY